MSLLTFPPSPFNGQLYPTTPLPGEPQYQWSAADNTWVLIGSATAVIPGCYGDGLTVPAFCVDAQGRLTSVINTPIAVTGGTVTDVTAGVGLLGGTITVSGTIDLDTAYTDGLYLSLAGGTMTGDITFSGTQTFPNTLHVASTVPANSLSPGAYGEVAIGTLGDFFFHDGVQWFKLTGVGF